MSDPRTAGNNADVQLMSGGRASRFWDLTLSTEESFPMFLPLRRAAKESSILVSVFPDACHAVLVMH